MNEQQKKRQRIYELHNAETKPKDFRNNWSFFMAFKPKPYPPWLHYKVGFRKQNEFNFPSKYWFA